MQDTKTGTSNADISGSTRAIEVSLAQGYSTKRFASNGTIKRGDSESTRRENSKSERIFVPGPQEHVSDVGRYEM
ncbi:hypothetical protein TYRP_009315 [Tyrophagus putrescentiae]|nr:hypothetical protein TYRP_009315 [Tyrophagus putrescentiae]